MKAIKKLLQVLPVIVKFAGIAMVIIETIEFFDERLRAKLGTIEVPEQKTDDNGENVSK